MKKEFNYQRFIQKSHVSDAILALGNVTPNTVDQVPYYEKILADGLASVGIPTVLGRQIKSKASRNFGKYDLVFLWSDEETSIRAYQNLVENAIKWFDEYIQREMSK